MFTVRKGYYSITTVNTVGKAKVWKLDHRGRHFQAYLYAEIKECRVLPKLCWGSEEDSLIVLFCCDGNVHSDPYDRGEMCPDFLLLQSHVNGASSFSFSCQSPTRKVILDERDGLVFQMRTETSP